MRLLPFICSIAGVLALLPLAAYAWTGPTGSPPNSNVSAPINVSSTSQSKAGGLGVTGYLNFGSTLGSSGYGLWDNGGTLEFKNSGGSWQSLQSIVYSYVSGTGQWTASGSNIYYSSGNVSVGTSTAHGAFTVVASGRAISASSQGAADWSGCFGSDCTGGTQTQYGVYANGSQYAAEFSGNEYVTGNIYSGSRGMWMSEAARDDGAQFEENTDQMFPVMCPSGSLFVGFPSVEGDNSYVCQWIN